MGDGEAEGTNLNIPLPAGCSAAAYHDTFDRIVVPALTRFRPDIIIVPSGFDAGHMDPMGRMLMHADGYRELTRKLLRVADESAVDVWCSSTRVATPGGPFRSMDSQSWRSCRGITTDVVDPYQGYASTEGLGLIAHQSAAIDAAAVNLERVPDHR